MINPDVSRVVYPPSMPGEVPTVVERLQADDLTRPVVLGLIALEHLAYQVQLKTSDDFSPESVSSADMRKETNRLRKCIENSHGLWVIRNTQPADELEMFDGFAHLKLQDEAVRLHQIHVRPPFQRGNGSRLLHAGLTADIWPTDVPFRLWAVKESSSNHMYRKLGMVPVENQQPGFLEMTTPKGRGVLDIVAELEANRSELAQAQQMR